MMQNEIFGALGHEYDHFLIDDLNGYKSPYLNGITVRAFNRFIRDGNWRVVVWRRNGVPTMGESARRSIPLKMFSSVNRALAHMPILEEVCLDRIAVILEKAERRA